MLSNEEEKMRSFRASFTLSPKEESKVEDKFMLRRSLRADKGNEKTAAKRLKKTIAWREEFGVDSITRCFRGNDDDATRALEEILIDENSTGKIYVRGKDKVGRAIIVMRPSNENTNNHDNNLKHLVYFLEKAVAVSKRNTITGEGDDDATWEEKICLIFDYSGYKMKHAPPLKTARATISILQDHYPERLHKAYFVNAPWFFRGFMKVVSPFIDAASKAKFRMVNEENAERKMGEDFDLSELETFAGGSSVSYGEKNDGYDAAFWLRKLDHDEGLPV